MMSTAVLIALAWWQAPVAQPAPDTPVRVAIVRALTARMGSDAAVTLERLEATVAAATVALRAVPQPGARTGRLISFALFDGARRVGTATAVVKVSLPHLRAAAPVARDSAITAADVVATDGELAGATLARVPVLREVVGATARRDIVAGEALTHALVAVPPVVRSGDEVEVVSRIGAVEARGTGRASGSGRIGARIRVTSGSTRALRSARVIAPGLVELIGPAERTQGE